MSGFAPRSMRGRNRKGLELRPAPITASSPLPGDGSLPNSSGSQDDGIEIGVQFRLDLQAEDLVVLKELGAGNGGSVSKVQHKVTKAVMARKIIHVEAKPEVRKRIVRELGIMHECNSPYIVSFYGAFMATSGDVVMCMEYADVGSLDAISKNFGPVRVDVLGKIAEAVLGGLTYLYAAHRIMHRDIKPSNILVNSKGNIKLCDFGVSSELENSVADTFVGTGTYMAPERISGSAYTVKSDVWSVGLTLMELAIGKFPFAYESEGTEDYDDGPQSILDLLQQIVMEPSPKLPKSDAFPQILDDMIAKCLMKAPEERPTPRELFEHDPFIAAAKRTPVDLETWAVSLMEPHNRKSHLPPAQQLNQAYPSTSPQPPHQILSSISQEHSPSSRSSSSRNPSATVTPTSQDIPITMSTLSIRDDRDHDAYDPYSYETSPNPLMPSTSSSTSTSTSPSTFPSPSKPTSSTTHPSFSTTSSTRLNPAYPTRTSSSSFTRTNAFSSLPPPPLSTSNFNSSKTNPFSSLPPPPLPKDRPQQQQQYDEDPYTSISNASYSSYIPSPSSYTQESQANYERRQPYLSLSNSRDLPGAPPPPKGPLPDLPPPPGGRRMAMGNGNNGGGSGYGNGSSGGRFSAFPPGS